MSEDQSETAHERIGDSCCKSHRSKPPCYREEDDAGELTCRHFGASFNLVKLNEDRSKTRSRSEILLPNLSIGKLDKTASMSTK